MNLPRCLVVIAALVLLAPLGAAEAQGASPQGPHGSRASPAAPEAVGPRGRVGHGGPGPSLAFYVQALFDGDELRFEAAAGRHLHGREPRASLDRLQLLGFLPDPEGSPNRIRSLGRGESPSLFSHLATRALLDVYGVRAGESARLRLAEIEREP